MRQERAPGAPARKSHRERRMNLTYNTTATPYLQLLRGSILAISSATLLVAAASSLQAQQVDSLLRIEPGARLLCRQVPPGAPDPTGQKHSRFDFTIGDELRAHRTAEVSFDSLGEPRKLLMIYFLAPSASRSFSATMLAMFDSGGQRGGLMFRIGDREAIRGEPGDSSSTRTTTTDLTAEEAKMAESFARWLWGVRCGRRDSREPRTPTPHSEG